MYDPKDIWLVLSSEHTEVRTRSRPGCVESTKNLRDYSRPHSGTRTVASPYELVDRMAWAN